MATNYYYIGKDGEQGEHIGKRYSVVREKGRPNIGFLWAILPAVIVKLFPSDNKKVICAENGPRFTKDEFLAMVNQYHWNTGSIGQSFS